MKCIYYEEVTSHPFNFPVEFKEMTWRKLLPLNEAHASKLPFTAWKYSFVFLELLTDFINNMAFFALGSHILKSKNKQTERISSEINM